MSTFKTLIMIDDYVFYCNNKIGLFTQLILASMRISLYKKIVSVFIILLVITYCTYVIKSSADQLQAYRLFHTRIFKEKRNNYIKCLIVDSRVFGIKSNSNNIRAYLRNCVPQGFIYTWTSCFR